MAVARKAPARAIRSAASIYQLHIELLDVRPAIWRRILVAGSIKLHKLHGVLLRTMGWAGGHLHEFVIGHDHYGEPDPYFNDAPRLLPDNRITLTSALGARKWFTYLYDYGDGWEHRVTVEQILPADPALKLKLPHCLDGANACPPEDVGGPPGYEDFLAAIRDPTHEEHDAMLEWCGGVFDPFAFDRDALNDSLHRFKP
jgi:hypothetical protein